MKRKTDNHSENWLCILLTWPDKSRYFMVDGGVGMSLVHRPVGQDNHDVLQSECDRLNDEAEGSDQGGLKGRKARVVRVKVEVQP